MKLKTYWICPITGIKIDAQDIGAIENHKKKIIEEQKNKQELKLKDKQIKVLRKEFKTINNLDELNNWLKKLYVIKAPKIKEKDVPFFSIPDFSTSTIVKDLNSGWITTCFLKINNQDVNFKKVFNGHNMTKDLNTEKDMAASLWLARQSLYGEVYKEEIRNNINNISYIRYVKKHKEAVVFPYDNLSKQSKREIQSKKEWNTLAYALGKNRNSWYKDFQKYMKEGVKSKVDETLLLHKELFNHEYDPFAINLTQNSMS